MAAAQALSFSASSKALQRRDSVFAETEGSRHGTAVVRFGKSWRTPDSARLHNKESKAFRSLSICKATTAEVDTDSVVKETGLKRNCRISPELQKITGEAELPRSEVVKRVWKYIRENNLQDPKDKRNIVCNAALAEVLGVDKTDMFGLSKLLSSHLTYEGSRSPRVPRQKKSSSGNRGAGIMKPVHISKDLQEFLGVSETEIARSEVVKLMWDYIKENNLQDPSDRRKVVCDKKLWEILQCESLLGISITKYLAPHFLKD